VLEDLAVIVDESVPADVLEAAIRSAGGKAVTEVRLFDVYRGQQVGDGKKSLAYSLTYQAEDRTLTDDEAAKIRQRIIRKLEQELNARIRSG
jgi:phenylalanyl-tRNA synthetase beta chain